MSCYLFYNGTSNDAFVIKWFNCWNLKSKLNVHVGELNSQHRNCVKACVNLMKKNQSIESSFIKHSIKAEADYLVRVKASLEAAKFLVRVGIAFRAHNEGEDSIYKGYFLEFIEALGRNNEKIGEAFMSGGNCKITCPVIQKELVNVCAVETLTKIVGEIGDGFFCVLVDESGDYSGKEQMVVVVRFVDDKGFVVERFIVIVHVEDTSAITLKDALENLLSRLGLCVSKIRGQGYDGASNMKGQFGGLKTLIQKENPQAYYVHCFAHQLQLALVLMARKHEDVDWFFLEVSRIVSFLRSSNKRQALLCKKQVAHFANLIENELVEMGTGFNQELSIATAGDTRWGSHFRNLSRLADLFTPIIEVLEDLKTLQKGDQDIMSALQLVQVSKKTLQQMRDSGCEPFYENVTGSCGNLEVNVLDMGSRYVQVFDTNSLVRLARLYPNDFVDVSDKELSSQLETYIECMKMDDNFSDLKSISDLCRNLMRTKKHKTFGFVYKLLKLALSLPVSTASVERVFYSIKYVKNELRNRISNPWFNDSLVTFVEKEVFATIDDRDIIKRFQGMSKRRMQLRLD